MANFFQKVLAVFKDEPDTKSLADSAKTSKPAEGKTPEQRKQEELAEMEARQNALYAKLTQAPREHQEKLLTVINQLHGVFAQGKGKNGVTKPGSEGRTPY